MAHIVEKKMTHTRSWLEIFVAPNKGLSGDATLLSTFIHFIYKPPSLERKVEPQTLKLARD